MEIVREREIESSDPPDIPDELVMAIIRKAWELAMVNLSPESVARVIHFSNVEALGSLATAPAAELRV